MAKRRCASTTLEQRAVELLEAVEAAIAPLVEARGEARPAAARMRRAAAGRGARCAMSRRASVGTSVRESRYEASIASTTASASGVNRKRAGPTSSTTGKKTMQMDSVATMAGTAICAAPSRMATVSGLPMRAVAVDVLDLDGGVVDQHADGQRQPAQGHDVDGVAGELEPDDARRRSPAGSRCTR